MEINSEPLKVTFSPPLHHQRTMWVLDIIRREHLTEIVDIGCGDGSLLLPLCQPAPWLGVQSLKDPDAELASLLSNVCLNDEDPLLIHTRRIVGLDISPYEIDIAARDTSPQSMHCSPYPRWEPLDVELWQGSVSVINPAFVNVECIVATEVIEHLTDDVLATVAPIVLGVYRPRFFLVTTPSYTFNQRWSAPGTTDPKGYLDPTGRTDRVFRHSDHKFEWTIDEFTQWCTVVARQWGYTVEPSSIGWASEKDPWEREKLLKGATQVAFFKRLDDHASKEKSERAIQDFSTPSNEPHKLVAKHCFEVHPRAGRPSDLEEIGEATLRMFYRWRVMNFKVRELWLWFEDGLSTLCGGSMELLISAIEHNPLLELQRIAGKTCLEWTVQLLGELPPELPVENAPMEVESDVREEDELEDDVGDDSFDSGVHMGSVHESNSWCAEETCWTSSSENNGEDTWSGGWSGGRKDDIRSAWGTTEEILWS